MSDSVKIFFREIEDAWHFIEEVLKTDEIAILLSDLPILVEVESITPLVQSLMKKYKCRLWEDFLRYLNKVSSSEKTSVRSQKITSSLKKLAQDLEERLPDRATQAIRTKACKDARRLGWPAEPTRQEGWSDAAWDIYSEAFKNEMSDINAGF